MLEAIEKGNTCSAESLYVLKNMRHQLKVTEDEHDSVMKELGIDDFSLFDPFVQSNRENKLRLHGYRHALELLLLKSIQSGVSPIKVLEFKQEEILTLRQEYAITLEEQQQLLAEIFHQDASILQTTEILLAQLQDSNVHIQLLSNFIQIEQVTIRMLLQLAVQRKKKLIITQLLSILEILGDSPKALKIADSMNSLAKDVIVEILHSEKHSRWKEFLSFQVITSLQKTQEQLTQPMLSSTQVEYVTTNSQPILDFLLELLQDNDSVVQATSLYTIHQLNSFIGFKQACQILDAKPNKNWLIYKTAQKIVNRDQYQNKPIYVPTLIAQVKTAKSTHRMVFQQLTIRVGRGDENDIVILDDRIHQQHAIFYLDDKGVIVEDLSSTQGLGIGRDCIHNKQRQLNLVDIVRFGIGDELLIFVQWKMQPLETKILGSLKSLEADVIRILLT